MDKLKSKAVIIFCSVITSLTTSCQNVPKEQGSKISSDTLGVVLVKPNEESFKIQNKNHVLLEGSLWDKTRISIIVVPLNDSIAEKLTYSNSKVLISKRQVKLIKGSYIEDGFSYHFNEKGLLSHVYKYKKGVLNGSFVSYFENGLVESKGFYNEGDKSGSWEYYDDKGKFLRKEKF